MRKTLRTNFEQRLRGRLKVLEVRAAVIVLVINQPKTNLDHFKVAHNDASIKWT
jgi:hypothetical protein